jgi:hypothetical protein
MKVCIALDVALLAPEGAIVEAGVDLVRSRYKGGD